VGGEPLAVGVRHHAVVVGQLAMPVVSAAQNEAAR
jgi:hypothetical protein